MKNIQHELSDREFYFVLYLSTLIILGWLLDINGSFLSKWFNLAGIIMVPILGSAIAFFAIFLKKRIQV